MIQLLINQVFPIINLFAIQTSIKLSPFKFLSPTPNKPTTPPSMSVPTLAFKSPTKHTFTLAPKPPKQSFKFSQNTFLSSYIYISLDSHYLHHLSHALGKIYQK